MHHTHQLTRVLTRVLTGAIASLWLGLVAIPFLAGSAVAAQRWVSPIGQTQRPTVLEGFDPPAQRWEAGHRGVDLAASADQAVHAAGSGTITFVGVIAGRGVVTVSHGELRTTYEPVNSSLSIGTEVAAGEFLGSIGQGGHCSSRCLHWGLRRADTYLDPMLLLKWEPPVLKPTGERAVRQVAAPLANAPNQRSEPSPEPGIGGPAASTATLATATAVGVSGAAFGWRRIRSRPK